MSWNPILTFPSVESVAALETRVGDVEPAAIRADSRVFDVQKYGAVGDGVTDDTAAILNALAAADAAGGGTIWLPRPVDYLCTTITTAGGLSWVIPIAQDTIAFDGVPGSGLKTTVNASLLHINGGGKPAGMANWLTYWLHGGDTTPTTPLTAINAVAKGSRTVTTVTPTDAGTFAAGDVMYIRTGHLLSTGGITVPDSELNEVISANATTGVITLRWPLSKPYAQEVYPAGHAAVGTNAPFGIAKVTDRVIRDVAFRTIKLTSTYPGRALAIGEAVIGLTMDCDVRSAGHYQSFNNVRGGRYGGRVHITDASGTMRWWFTTATGTTDVVIDDPICTADGAAQIHIHEGSAKVRLDGGTYEAKGASSADQVMSVRARAYDIELRPAYVDAGAGYIIYVGNSCRGGGVIDGVRGRTSHASQIGTIGAPNWTIGPTNDFNQYLRVYDDVSGFIDGPLGSATRVVSAWVTDTYQTVSLGVLPIGAYVTAIHLHVREAFNSDGTDLLNVGSDAVPGRLVTNLDVSTTGVKTWVPTGFAGYTAATNEIKLFYTNGGSEPTTGKVLVVLVYAMVAAEPA